MKHEHSNFISAVIKPSYFCFFQTNCTLVYHLIAKDRPWNNSQLCACPHVPNFKPLKRNPACKMLLIRSLDKCWCRQRLCHSDRKIETTLPGVERKACGYLNHDDYTNEEEHKNDEDNMLLEASKGDLLRVNLRAGKPATPPGMSRVAKQLPSCFI